MRESIESALSEMFGHPVSPTGNWLAVDLDMEICCDLGPKDLVSIDEAQRKAFALGVRILIADDLAPYVKRRKIRDGKKGRKAIRP